MKKWSSLLALLIMFEILNAVLYLGSVDQFGFPLDDAWIHQTYARNLGLHGVMAFSSGQPSTGSTSPGWTILLAMGYKLKVPFLGWTYILGGIFAVATAFTAAALSESYFKDFKRAVIVAIICIVEWHLAWAAFSGMEVGLFTFLTLLILLLIHRKSSPLLMGSLIGVAFLVRPEAVILAVLYGVRLLLTRRENPKQLLTTTGIFIAIFLIIISPYVMFNLTYSGRPFPNTVSAKFMMYGYPWSPWKSLKYLLDVLIYFSEGPSILLVLAAGFLFYKTFRLQRTDILYPLVWPLTLIGIYAIALPTIFDHGRYLMPLMPILTIYGVEGLFKFLERFPGKSPLRLATWLTFGSMVILLWVHGAADFAYRVKLLTETHLRAANWINANTPPDAIVATHDIGIIGYFTQRQIVDLAGLVTPEVVPIMKNQTELAGYVHEKHATHLVVFSGYYREMLAQLDARLVFSPNKDYLISLNREPLEVFEIPAP